LTWLKTHRLLLVVYSGVALLAVFEVSNPRIRSGQHDSPDVYLSPATNIADVSAELYPDRALSLYHRAYQAALCGEAGADAEVCRRRGPVKPGEIRDLLARAVATGNRSVELALYNYALVLVQEGAPAQEIDAAVRAWRKSHPGSARLDPRKRGSGASGG
jgi:hypothetical protein